MGLALSWVAVRGKTPEQVLTGLDASLTGRQGVFAENRFGARQLRRGWYALYAQECGHPWVHEESLALLSGGAEVLACQLDEHLMFSSAELWRAGERQWRVIHDAQLGADHLAAEGALPEVYGPIAAEQRQLRAGATAKIDLFFEVPLKLA